MRDTEKPEDPGDRSRDSPPHSPNPGEWGTPEEDWPESEELDWAETSAQEMAAYAATVRRIEFLIGVVGAVGAAAVAWPLGWAVAGGVVAGTVLGWINFRWLAASVNAIGERIVKVKSRERGAAVVARGVGRIFLIALVAYVIFTCSVRGLVGFLAGLAMPVIALMCEAAYEFVASNRRSS
jgi:hypothetical protein